MLAVPLAMMAVVGTLSFNFQVVLPLLVTRTFDRSKATFTILFSCISLGSLVGALWTARRRSIGVIDVVKASFAFGVTMLALAVAPSIAWAFPIGAVMGMASIGFLTASTAIVQTKAAPEMRGRVLASRPSSSWAAPPSAAPSWATCPSTSAPATPSPWAASPA